MNKAEKPAVVLVSGGMDSAVVLAIAREQGHAVHALSVRYGQRHTSELDAAERVARMLGAVQHKTVNVDLRSFGGSALTDDIAVPTDADGHAIGDGIPSTYVPARNTILLALALGASVAAGDRDPILHGLGFVALIALAPILSVMALGFIMRPARRQQKD